MVDEDPARDIRRLLDHGVERLRGLSLSRTAPELIPQLVRTLRRHRELAAADSVTRLRRDLETITAVLSELESGLLAIEPPSAAAVPLSDEWWTRRRRELLNLRRENPSAGDQLWLTSWVDALAGARYDVCSRLVELAPERRSQFGSVSSALELGDARAALPILGELLDGDLPEVDALRLMLLRARVVLSLYPDGEVAQLHADAALERARALDASQSDMVPTWWTPLALAVLAEVMIAVPRLDSAEDLLKEAAGQAVVPPDVYVAEGLLAERRRDWGRADDAYDHAIELEGEPGWLPGLLPPRPSRLRYRKARSLRKKRLGDRDQQPRRSDLEQALAEVTAALAGDLTGGPSLEGQVLIEKAQILEELGRTTDAAQAYAQAGNVHIRSGEGTRAVYLFEHACELHPTRAEYHWILAEALRSQSSPADGTVDLVGMRKAARAMETGLARSSPDRDHAWALVTLALIVAALPGDERDPALLIERALVLSPGYSAGFGFLAAQLRRNGYLQEAHEAAVTGHRHAPDDQHVAEQLITTLSDLRDYPAAIQVAEEHLDRWPGHQQMLIRYAVLQLRLGRPERALEVLADADGLWARLVRANALAAAGAIEDSRATFAALWHSVRSGQDRGLIGWTLYRMGGAEQLDEAIQIFTDLTSRALGPVSYPHDLGQMHLVRGQGDDLTVGEDLLRQGIARSTFVDELVQLGGPEFDLVRYDVAGQAHEAQVDEILTRLGPHIAARCDELLRNRRPPGDAVMAAEARTAVEVGDAYRALGHYVTLAGRGVLPEAGIALSRAAEGVVEMSDELVRGGLRSQAWTLWTAVESAAGLMRSKSPWAQVQARMTMNLLLDGQDDAARRSLRDVLAAGRSLRNLSEAVEVFAADTRVVWALADRLAAVAADPDTPARHRKVLGRLAGQLPLATAYQLAGDETLEPSIAASVTAVEVRLGAQHASVRSDGLLAGIPVLRDRLTATMGLTVPGVRVVTRSAMPADQIEIRIFEAPVVRFSLPADQEDRAETVLAALEEELRAHLFRLVGPDDVVLWLEGWDPISSPTPDWDPPDPRAARLRLVRVLRLLLRERIPVRDRTAVLEVFQSFDEDGGGNNPLDILRAARLRLGADELGYAGRDQCADLPESLEARLRAGYDGAPGTAWELDRVDAAALVRDLRSWLESLPHRPGAVVVAEPVVRPYLWRLLAAERPLVRVLSAEELP